MILYDIEREGFYFGCLKHFSAIWFRPEEAIRTRLLCRKRFDRIMAFVEDVER
jgi:hypothetical protein